MLTRRSLLLGGALSLCRARAASFSKRLLSFADAADIAAQFQDAPREPAWDSYIRARDKEARSRVKQGFEDSLTNLLLYGSSFTNLPPLPSPAAGLTPAGNRRIAALVAAIASKETSERILLAREALGLSGKPAAAIERILRNNLRRVIREQAAYDAVLDRASKTNDPGQALFLLSTMYERRGLSIDTSLLPNLGIERTLARLAGKSVLPKPIRKIAVVGGGLDFADKRDGADFYPIQSLQPFAVADAVLRTANGGGGMPEVTVMDINTAVVGHWRIAGERAASGRPYTLQLPRDNDAGWTAEALDYWNHFGERVGAPGSALPPPPTRPWIRSRAVNVPAVNVRRIQAIDLNIVAETLEPPAQFDLIVATNVLVYYGRLEQATALATISRMLTAGGIFISNTVLPAQRPAALEYLGRNHVNYSVSGRFGDDLVVYRRRS